MPITYRSTRGAAPELGFADVLLAGLATDGGLYVPAEIPGLDASLASTDALRRDGRIHHVALRRRVDRTRSTSTRWSSETYEGFSHIDVAPLVDLGHKQWLCDLSHGPTLAFKDFALQLLGRLLDFELTRRDERVTVIGATSGDTGSAAIHALAHRDRIDVVILHPEGRGQRGATAADDNRGRRRTSPTSPFTAPSTTVRIW